MTFLMGRRLKWRSVRTIGRVSLQDLMHRAAIALAAATLALFVVLNLAMVMNRGVCCADDAYAATVAKNLAWGFGYSVSISFLNPADFTLKPFDVSITTGPALILPVSGAIRILGNRFWVPGVVQITIWTVLLVAVWRALGSVASRSRVAIVGVLFVLVGYAVSPYHFEQWNAMLGEVPAALAVLLGVTIWAAHPRSSRHLFIGATLCSLAVLTKLVAAIYAAMFLTAAVLVGLSGPGAPMRLWQLLRPLLLGFLLPILAFEVWKAAALGEEYLAQLRAFRQFSLDYGTSPVAFSLAEIGTRLTTFSTRFGVSLPGLLIFATFGGSLAWRTGSPAFRRLYLVLLAGVVVHSAYWLGLSLGWPRHLFIGVIVLSALLTLPYLALQRPVLLLLYSGALTLSLLGTVSRLHVPISDLGSTWFVPSASRSGQESVVKFLDARRDRRPFVGQYWAPVIDLQYLSNGVLDFKGYTGLTPEDLSRGVLVVTNSRFDTASDEKFSSLVASCGPPVLIASPYSIHECGGTKALSWVPTTGEVATRAVPTTTTPADIQGAPSVAAGGCNLERVGDQLGSAFPVPLRRGELLRLSGWIVDEREHRVPPQPYIALQAINTRETWYVSFSAELPREDVARARHHEAYRPSGFSVSIDTTALPPAEYRLFLLFRNSGPPSTCDNGRRLVLR